MGTLGAYYHWKQRLDEEPLLFHQMLKQGITWLTLTTGTQETV